MSAVGFFPRGGMTHFLRALVSGPNRRFVEGSYDLDLSYVHPRMIAMGLPAIRISSIYRNPANSVRDFLAARHAGHYKVYNLTEKGYADSVFGGAPVEHWPFPDHHAPPFQLLLDILKSMHQWLAADNQNVVVCHCLAGHGRTGVALTSLLMYEGICANAAHALQTFSDTRSNEGKGVANPAQIRSVYYAYDHFLRCARDHLDVYVAPPAPSRVIAVVSFGNWFPGAKRKPFRYRLRILDGTYHKIWSFDGAQDMENGFAARVGFQVQGDFSVKVRGVDPKKNKKYKSPFLITLNTLFLEGCSQIELPKAEIDGAHKDVRKYGDLTAVISFGEADAADLGDN